MTTIYSREVKKKIDRYLYLRCDTMTSLFTPIAGLKCVTVMPIITILGKVWCFSVTESRDGGVSQIIFIWGTDFFEWYDDYLSHPYLSPDRHNLSHISDVLHTHVLTYSIQYVNRFYLRKLIRTPSNTYIGNKRGQKFYNGSTQGFY